MGEARCEKTDLLVSQCAHCRPAPVVREVPFGGVPKIGSNVMIRFTAKFEGQCGECGTHLSAGGEIGRSVDGTYLCRDCCDDADREVMRG